MEKYGAIIKVRVIRLFIAVLLMVLLYWFMLPPINIVSPDFWVFILISFLIFALVILLPGISGLSEGAVIQVKTHGNFKSGLRTSVLIMSGVIVLIIILLCIGLPIFNASQYKDLLIREEGNFTEDVAELSMNQIPVVDRDTATQLGKRKLGEIAELVSQFEIAEDYTQINFENRPVRITPLVYGDIFKWLNNNNKGVPAYIKVDMVTQETTLVQLKEGMKYAPCEFFMRDLTRHLRFAYPTKMFDTYTFEIDESGTPYWIAPTYRYRIGVWGGRDIEGAVLVNAIDGAQKWYAIDEIPQWVDRLYRADMIMKHLNYNGEYQDGFFNSIIGQRGVLQTTAGYNYIAANDDVYLYTGMTSTTGDESNVGFVLVNMRTKATRFYSVPGAEETSAMSSAMGQVQHLGYISTFPILLNVADRPTYFMSLKDAAKLVKMYAFVDVERFQIVGTGTSVVDARSNYIKALTQEEGVSAGAGTEIKGVVAQVVSAVVDGNTNYYIRFDGSNVVFIAPIQLSGHLPFLNVGDSVKLTYSGNDETREALTLEVLSNEVRK